MKKALTLGAASAIALAAMPVAGVFAAESTTLGTVTDTVNVTVKETCAMTTTAEAVSGQTNQWAGSYNVAKEGNNPTTTLSNGQTGTVAGSPMTVKCNAGKGWMLTVAGDGTGTDKTTMVTATSGTDGTTPIATGTSGDNSFWNVSLALSGTTTGAEIQNHFGGAQAIPAATGLLGVKAENATDVETGVTITPTYTVSISQSQGAGTYTGKVKYTIVSPYSAS